MQTIDNPITTDFFFRDDALQAGEIQYRIKIVLSDGKIIYSNIEKVFSSSEAQPVIIYPNPATHASNLKVIVNEVGLYRIEIVDLHGRSLHQQKLNSSFNSIGINNLPAGIYFIAVYDNTKRLFTQKLIVY